MKQTTEYIFLDDITPVESEENIPLPLIFDFSSGSVANSPLEGFNAVKISLDGKSNSSLDWRAAAEEARTHVGNGLKVFWELDLGLFEQLNAPISDQTQYMTLGLSIQHFRDTLWKEFQSQSIGISIYRGSIDFSSKITWDVSLSENMQGWLVDRFQNISALNNEIGGDFPDFKRITPELLLQNSVGDGLLKLFCCDAAVDYLDLLAGQFPGELPVCVCLKIDQINDPFLLARLLSKERFERLQRIVSKGIMPVAALTRLPAGIISQASCSVPSPNASKLGICLPSNGVCRFSLLKGLQQSLREIIRRETPYIIIPEATLTVEWDGLDHLIVAVNALSSQGLRKLRGFCAAGGTVVVVDNPEIDLSVLPNVVSFNEFLRSDF